MVLLWLPILALVAASEHSFCGGDDSYEEFIPSNRRHLIQRSTVLEPIRVHFSYYNFDLVDPVLTSTFMTKVVPTVERFLSSSLSVYRIIGNLVLSSTNCLSNVVVPNDHKTIGVPNADIIIYLASNTLTTASYEAKAGTCERQSNGLNNPLAGTITFNAPNVADNSFSSLVTILSHEVTHILAFAGSHFNHWKNSNGLSYAAGTLSQSVIIRGAAKTIIVTPTVVTKAREAFDCPDIQGVELEEYMPPGDTSPNTHWDKRIMMNDYMVPFVPPEPYWSTITLAALKDSGWYDVDYGLALAPTFGTSSKCKFFNMTCLVGGVSNDPTIWRDVRASWTCDPLALNKGNAKLVNYTAIPSEFQYFSYSLTGGLEEYSDYCPYVYRYSNGACRGNSQTTFTFTQANEVIGPKSRCFDSNLIIKGFSKSPPYSACYEVTDCNSTHATVKIGTTNIFCPFTGSTQTVSGYTGTIKCPASNVLCQNVPCRNYCYSRGTCVRGVCTCDSGYGDVDCSSECSASCTQCSSPSVCTVCQSGYYLSSGACLSCSGTYQNCLTCDSNGCLTCESGFVLSNGVCS